LAGNNLKPALNKAVFSMGVDCIFSKPNAYHYRNTIEYEKRKANQCIKVKKVDLEFGR